jgi:hypothetical protein
MRFMERKGTMRVSKLLVTAILAVSAGACSDQKGRGETGSTVSPLEAAEVAELTGDTDGDTGNDGEEAEEAPQMITGATDDYLARMDSESSEIVVAPRISVTGGALRVDALLEAVQAEQPMVDVASAVAALGPEGAGATLQGDCEQHLRPSTGRILLRDLRAFKTEDPVSEAEEVEPDVLEARAKRLVAALDPATDGEHIYQVHTVASEGVASDGRYLGRRKVAKKVFVYRTIGGIPVHGDKLVFSFTLDGDLRKVRGQWRPVDVSGSELSGSLPEDQVVPTAVEAVAARTPLSEIDRFWIRTRYKVDGDTVQLRGFVTIQRKRGLGSVIEFAL